MTGTMVMASRVFRYILSTRLAASQVPDMKTRPLRRFAACAAITLGIAAWPSICDARWQANDHNLRPIRHGLHFRHGLHVFRQDLHVFRKGVLLPSLHSSYPCSVLGHRPCVPYGTYCSIFSRQPCIPDIDYPIGQTLQLTILSRTEDGTPDKEKSGDRSPHDLNTIRDVFTALRGCWIPPEKDAARAGTEITLRFSFNSHGGMISKPRTTYVSADTPPDVIVGAGGVVVPERPSTASRHPAY